ncbi:MAG: hypothetical protein EXX96DRAFT_492199 [Benjaminiella poitrasii]|nr:MAG: hypothetical protein EXX96DRAFT_492199 [Benjaminiella poitrasii]
MGWLPGKPHDCPCTRDHTSRRHFNKYECEAIATSLWNDLPAAPPDVHIIDHAINELPSNPQRYCPYWPSLLSILWQVECLVRPEIQFPEDLDPGALWRTHSLPHNQPAS